MRSLVRIKRYTDDLDSAASIIIAMALLIEARDGNTEGHCHRMANYATALGRALDLSEDDLAGAAPGGFLHDIGMLAIPDSLLRKTGPLDPDEFELMKSHTTVGDSLCGNLRSLDSVRPIIRHHHERYDGSGYPDGLAGDEIPLVAQIMGVVDVYDAVTTRRPYQGPHSAAGSDRHPARPGRARLAARRPRRLFRGARRERPPRDVPGVMRSGLRRRLHRPCHARACRYDGAIPPRPEAP